MNRTRFRQRLWLHSDVNMTRRNILARGFKYPNEIQLQNSIRTIGKREINNPIYPPGPESLDWRDFGLVTPPEDQGYECRSCYAFR